MEVTLDDKVVSTGVDTVSAVDELAKLDLSHSDLAIVVEYATNGGNLSSACKALGYASRYGTTRKRRNPDFVEALRLADERIRVATVTPLAEWNRLKLLAQRKLEELLSCTTLKGRNDLEVPDNAIQFAAAKSLLEQAVGKPRQKVEYEDVTPVEDRLIPQDIIRLALQIIATRGGELQPTVEWVMRNRAKAVEWVQGPAGSPVVDAEVIIEEDEPAPGTGPEDTSPRLLPLPTEED